MRLRGFSVEQVHARRKVGFWRDRDQIAVRPVTDTIIAMATVDDAALLFPVGHCLGAYYDLPASN
ncbi:MAG: hypothetical protein M3313_08930, partial [Actinomycetota bacterium]|nr:hypothetical protein [Actinomycetota bacterium]